MFLGVFNSLENILIRFFGDRKNRLRDEEIKLSNKRYGSYGDSSHPHDTKNLIPMNQKIV